MSHGILWVLLLMTVRAAKELLEVLSLRRLARSLTNCHAVKWKSGEQGNNNQVQLGFVPYLYSANRLPRIPYPPRNNKALSQL